MRREPPRTGSAAEQLDELPAVHSIPSSARASTAASDGPGLATTVRPTTLVPYSRRGFGLAHPNRKEPRDPQGEKIKREENDEAGITAKRALHNQPNEIGREAAP